MKCIIGCPTYSGYYRVDWLLNSIHLRSNDADRKILQESRIVICDDSGKDDHREKVRNVINKWNNDLHPILIINERNLGVASSWNRIVRSERSDYVVLINDDIILSGGWLDSIVGFLEANPQAGAVGGFAYIITKEDIPKLLSSPDAIVTPRDPFTKAAVGTYTEDNERPGRCMCAPGCFFGFRTERWREIGGFDENYFSFYEETDFGTALASKGFPSYCLAWPKNWHIWSATFGESPEINAGKIMIESRVYYTNKWQSHTEVTHPRYMGQIPFMKVKWRYKNNEYEDLIVGDVGR